MTATQSSPEGALPRWAAVIVNWNGAADLPACLAALASQHHPADSIIVIDNASTDGSLAALRQVTRPRCQIIASSVNLGFAGGANAGVQATSTPLVAVLNPDVTLDPDWSYQLCAAFVTDRRLGAAGGKLLFPGRVTLQHAGGAIDPTTLVAANIGRGERDEGQHDVPTDVAFVTGAALMLRRAAFDQVGGFDEAFYPAYYEDVDLCTRLRDGGWLVRCVPTAAGVHRESASIDGASAAYYRLIHAGRLRYAAKHLSTSELLHRFVPAEAQRLSEAAIAEAGVRWPDETGWTVFPSALFGRAVTDTPSPAQPESGSSLRDVVQAVGTRWLVSEQPFRSGVPGVGRAIAWLRERIIDLGPRWHVQALVAQQIEFNAATFRALRAIAATAQAGRLQADAQSGLVAERLATVTADYQRLAERLADLEARLARLSSTSED